MVVTFGGGLRLLGTLLIATGVVPMTTLGVDRAPEGVPVTVGGLVVPPGVASVTEIGVTGGIVTVRTTFCFVGFNAAVIRTVLFVLPSTDVVVFVIEYLGGLRN